MDQIADTLVTMPERPVSTVIRPAKPADCNMPVLTQEPTVRYQQVAIVRVEGLDIAFKELQNVAPSEIHRFALSVVSCAEGCDALYLPCGQWQASQVVDALEKDSGKPVIAYTHANFFAAFKALGLRDRIHGHGRLLASLAAVSG